MTRYLDPPELSRGATYSHAVRSGQFVFVTGQVPLDASGALIGKGDVRRQAQQVYENLACALAAAGARLTDVVRLDSYYVDAMHRSAILDVRRSYLGEHRPASTSVIVSSLADPDWLLEVQAIAIVEDAVDQMG